MPNFRGEYVALHPKFPKGSAAACVRLEGPPVAEMVDLVYTPEDNVAVEEYVKQRADTTWHSVSIIVGCMRSYVQPSSLWRRLGLFR
jgi:alcohol oxidase